jgi:hypothetical protein
MDECTCGSGGGEQESGLNGLCVAHADGAHDRLARVCEANEMALLARDRQADRFAHLDRPETEMTAAESLRGDSDIHRGSMSPRCWIVIMCESFLLGLILGNGDRYIMVPVTFVGNDHFEIGRSGIAIGCLIRSQTWT